jgi:molecular chaperone GrpE
MSAEAKNGGSEETEGWESLAEESEGSLASSPELEAALQEALDAVEAPRGRAPAGGSEPAGGHETGAGGAAAADPGVAGEPAAGEAAAPAGPEAAAELAATKDRLVRLHADFENFRRRALKERSEVQQYGHQNLVKDLLSSVDNLDRAIEHAQRSAGGDLESLLQGVELVRRDLMGALAKHGVSQIEAQGKVFDPALHEAMAQAPDDTVAAGTVVEELQKGYLLRDRLLRPSRVVVARPCEAGEGGSGD